MKARFLKVNLKRWRKMGSRVFPWAEKFSEWDLPWPSRRQEANSIPRDVPKGHVAVYVGENCKRFVIKIALLKHPQFRVLLDQARDVYDFIADSKLCIPCDEHIFISTVHCCTDA